MPNRNLGDWKHLHFQRGKEIDLWMGPFIQLKVFVITIASIRLTVSNAVDGYPASTRFNIN